MPVLLAAPYAHGNPLQKLLYASLPAAGITVRRHHGWPSARDIDSIDVLHLGWPDRAVGRASSDATLARRLTHMLRSITAAQSRGTRVIFTLHNARPRHLRHQEAIVRFTRDLLRRADTIHVFDQRHIAVAKDMAGTTALDICVIPHPLYPLKGGGSREQRSGARTARQTRIAALGFVRQDKRLQQLADVVREVVQTEGIPAKLIIGGRPNLSTTSLIETLQLLARAAIGTELSIRPWRHTDRGFERLMATCDVAVVGNSEALNSGTVFLALALGLPIVAPERTLPSSLVNHPRISAFRHAHEFPAALAEQVRATRDMKQFFDYGPLLADHRPEAVSARFCGLVLGR